jgi:hypothetical protein
VPALEIVRALRREISPSAPFTLAAVLTRQLAHGHGTPGTVQALENSEVSPLGLVAVAVTTCPLGTFFLVMKVKLASPFELVVVLFWPRKVCPSLLPEGSAAGLAKNWKL